MADDKKLRGKEKRKGRRSRSRGTQAKRHGTFRDILNTSIICISFVSCMGNSSPTANERLTLEFSRRERRVVFNSSPITVSYVVLVFVLYLSNTIALFRHFCLKVKLDKVHIVFCGWCYCIYVSLKVRTCSVQLLPLSDSFLYSWRYRFHLHRDDPQTWSTNPGKEKSTAQLRGNKFQSSC